MEDPCSIDMEKLRGLTESVTWSEKQAFGRSFSTHF